MRRLVAILLAAAFAPGALQAQADAPMHTVVRGETLWGLAERFCGDPFDWPEIYRANQSQIADPHWISPGQELTIACASSGQVRDMQVSTPDRPMPEEAAPATGQVDERSRRSVFYRDMSRSVSTVEETSYAVMSRDHAWAAPYFQYGIDEDPWSIGTIGTLLAGEDTRTAMPYGRVRVTSTGAMPAVGDAVQIYRVERELGEVGLVIRPTGVMSVTAIGNTGFDGVVLKSYDRVRVGDFVGPAPAFTLTDDQRAADVNSAVTAEIITFDPDNTVKQLGHVAILDRGGNNGVSVGDEYDLVLGDTDGFPGVLVGTLQVVRVDDETSSARIIQINERAFDSGQTVRLNKKMR